MIIKRNEKRILSVLLAVAICLGSVLFTGTTALAQDGQETNAAFEYYGNQLTGLAKQAYEALKTVEVFETEISIPIADFEPIPYDDYYDRQTKLQQIAGSCSAGVLSFINDYPEMFWINGSIAINCSIGSGRFTELNLKLTTLGYNSSTMSSAAFPDGVETALALFNEEFSKIDIQGDTRYDIIKNAHDYIATIVTYDDDAAADYSSAQTSYTPYGALINGKSVCEGYAELLKMICDKYDIPCITVSGDGITNGYGKEGHKWNMVQMEDGKWYGIDPTWDDQDSGIYYDFFLSGWSTVPTSFSPKIGFAESHIPSIQIGTTEITFEIPPMSRYAYSIGGEEGTALFTNTDDYYGSQLTGYAAKFYNILKAVGPSGLMQSPNAGINGVFFEMARQAEFEAEMEAELQKATDAWLLDNPGTYWVDRTRLFIQRMMGTNDKWQILSAYIYIYPQSEYKGKVTTSKNAMIQAVDALDFSASSESETVKKIYEYMKNNITVLDASDAAAANTAYGALINKEATSKGFAQLFKMLCDIYGVECVSVEGTIDTAEEKIWSAVKLENGKWYAVDTCSDTQQGVENILLVGRNTYIDENNEKIFSDIYNAVSDNDFTTPTLAERSFDTSRPNMPGRLRGDVNNDGKVSMLDALLIQRSIVKIIVLSDEDAEYGDVDDDGKLSLKDVLKIQKYLAYIIDEL